MKLYTKMSDNTKQVRVDNWGIFFLQRLQMFFSKTDYCDMTLQFDGNVQLKVHRLVMNACTEYFQFLEETCTLEENVIMMPSDLQADVIVPIVNFMYTGMLEFNLSIFDRLYHTAQVMNITILTKLLDAQKQPTGKSSLKKRHLDSPNTHHPQAKKQMKSQFSDLPAPLPGCKLPIWKRRTVPAPPQPQTHVVSPLCYPEPKWSSTNDPLSIPDSAPPKPTRFEWPDDDLPNLNLLDTRFEDISYTSKPLMTKAEEHRASTSFDDLKHIPNANRAGSTSKQGSSTDLDMEEMKNYVKEQKIRSGLSHTDEDDLESGTKRKSVDAKGKVLKKVRFDEQDSKTATISIAGDAKNSDLDHQKIVTEILKKYPQLMKKNKNIRLKIMAKNKNEGTPAQLLKRESTSKTFKTHVVDNNDSKSPWVCERCSTQDNRIEFALYYLYRKHMTDVHNDKFDPKLCKYCGHKCSKPDLLLYHLYTKHGLKPPPASNFPKCDMCPFIALSATVLAKHKERHDKNEIQCVECKLTFTSQATLTSHVQITGHTGKSLKYNYDCQYCTKKYQSGVNLFSHVRLQHRNEAIRDGIVSVDEADDVEAEEEEKDEYILPEIIPDDAHPKKINILSDVKVQDQAQHQISLELSSEAEALNNVATGIATSLGLVDIVVLNDNQQLFLQSNQQSYSGQSEQPEFILPELTTQNQSDVMTQSMLSSGDIASTDELVMVLTDHDYGDNQEDSNNDNSNIVVLYSHPMDGQQNQFITSQSNIMVNPQTALFEIRNGATNQVVMTQQDTHIESIEMIQREIESHTEIKPDSLYEMEMKPDEESKSMDKQQSDALINSLVQGAQIEFATPLPEDRQEFLVMEEDTEAGEKKSRDETQTLKSEGTCKEDQTETNDALAGKISEEEAGQEANPSVDGSAKAADDTNQEHEGTDERIEHENGGQAIGNCEERTRGVEFEDEERTDSCKHEEERVQTTEHEDRAIDEPTSATIQEDEERKDSEIEEQVKDTIEANSERVEDTNERTREGVEDTNERNREGVEDTNERNREGVEDTNERNRDGVEDTNERNQEGIEETNERNQEGVEDTNERNREGVEDTKERNREGVETSKDDQKRSEDATERNDTEAIERSEDAIEERSGDTSEELAEDTGEEREDYEVRADDTSDQMEESMEEEKAQENSDTSTSQDNDDNSQESAQVESSATKISILDDWEDTDSQSSEQKEKVAEETVHKLIDDWEDDDEDDKKVDG